jgi:hypothetical protein
MKPRWLVWVFDPFLQADIRKKILDKCTVMKFNDKLISAFLDHGRDHFTLQFTPGRNLFFRNLDPKIKKSASPPDFDTVKVARIIFSSSDTCQSHFIKLSPAAIIPPWRSGGQGENRAGMRKICFFRIKEKEPGISRSGTGTRTW